MIIYSEENVYHAALNRIRFLYDEFPNIVATWSGGKDSTVVMNLCLEVAKEKNRLPLDVFWIDQEFEWNSTVDYARIIKKNTDIRFHWMQVPLAYDNATSNKETKIISWDPQKQWMREKEPDSIQDGDYGIEGFFKAFQRWQDHVFGNDKVCLVGGLRVEENPSRRHGLTNNPIYPIDNPWVTWCRTNTKGLHYSFYPIYDWTTSDIWKYIAMRDVPYNDLYNAQYRHGIRMNAMRCSGIVHENALSNILYMQEFEPDTYARLTKRLNGIASFKHTGQDLYFNSAYRSALPLAFSTWTEYRDHLMSTLLSAQDSALMQKAFAKVDSDFEGMSEGGKHRLMQCQISTIFSNDTMLVKLRHWISTPQARVFLRWKKTGFVQEKDIPYAQNIPESAGFARNVGTNRKRRRQQLQPELCSPC